MITTLGAFVVVVGGVFCVIGGIGLVKFPDVYSRMHASGIGDTLGAALVLGGLMIMSLDPGEDGALVLADFLRVIKLVFILFFMWVSGTTAAHAVAKAAWLAGVEPWTAEGRGGPSKD
jgi:multicomponent Na+:H+ antiporter subunit G